MRSAGFTLVELLVVIAIISIMSLIGVASFKSFSDKQPGIKAQGQVQTLLRLAQSNASTSTLCNGVGSTSWSLKFIDNKTIQSRCEPSDYLYRTYILDNAQMTINCSGGSDLIPATTTFTYSTGTGKLTTVCSAATYPIIFTITNTSIAGAAPKIIKVSLGGTINVE